MKKDIKDYLHLYLGQEVIFLGKDRVFLKNNERRKLKYDNLGFWMDCNEGKLLLRPLSDMTEQEKNTWLSIQYYKEGYDSDLQFAEALRTQYLLKQSFDLFGLIEDGLAIDKTTLTQQP